MKAHICIGGPLAGLHATSDDFHGCYPYAPGTRRRDYKQPKMEGMYQHLKDDYFQFNTASRAATGYRYHDPVSGKAKRNDCHVVWLHKSCLIRPLAPSQR